MSKRDKYESILSGVYPVPNQDLDDAFEDVVEESYERGYEDGYKERGGEPSTFDFSELRGRYEYLRAGGEWDRDEQPNAYLAGFEDAMKTLGVKP